MLFDVTDMFYVPFYMNDPTFQLYAASFDDLPLRLLVWADYIWFLSSSVWQTWAEHLILLQYLVDVLCAALVQTDWYINTTQNKSTASDLVWKVFIRCCLCFRPQGWGISCACISSPVWIFVRQMLPLRGTYNTYRLYVSLCYREWAGWR